MRYRLLFIVLLFALPAVGQSLRGVITDAQTGKPLWPVTVVNKETQQFAYSNEFGEYSIMAKPGQKLSFSLVGYQTISQTMPPTLSAAQVNISLQHIGFELDEVIIRPRFTPYQADSIQRRRTYSRALAQRHAPVMSPVSFVAEKFSRRSKQVFRFQKNYNNWEDERFVDSRYSADLVSQLTGLQDDSLGYFMNAYSMPYDYARTATDLEIKMWIRYNYKEWKRKQADSTAPVANKPE